MRPQDVVVLLKMISWQSNPWQNKDLAQALFISPSEVSEALNRNYLAGLVDYGKKKVRRQSFYEFLVYGLRYVFPQNPGGMINGIPTAHSHPFMKKHFRSDLAYVWPDINGNVRGLAIEPLYLNQVKAAKDDENLYKLLALVDVLRVGRAREIDIAVRELKKIVQYESREEPA